MYVQTAGPSDFQNVSGISFLPANFTIGEDSFSSITENSLVVLDDFSFKLANNKQAKINFLKVVNYILVIHKLVYGRRLERDRLVVRHQHPKNVMTYTTAAKTDKPTDWKALWISFGDVAFSKKNDSHGSDLAFNRSSRTGQCGLSNDGTCIRFPIFRLGCCGEDDWVADVAEIPVPTVIEKLFFEKVARLIQYTCDCNPEYSVEAFDKFSHRCF